MVRRYYISPMLGTGTATDPYAPKMRALGFPFIMAYAQNADGTLAVNWCLVRVDADDHTVLLNDVDLDAFPLMALSDLMSSLSQNVQNAIRTRLANRGLTQAQIDNLMSGTFGRFLRLLGQRLNARFDEITFGVG